MLDDMLMHPLVWWRDVPIDVEIGLLTYLSAQWKNDIYIICANDYEQARKACGWVVDDLDNVHFIIGTNEIQKSYVLIQHLIDDVNCLHLSSGVKGGHKCFLDQLKKNSKSKCVFIMESPSIYGKRSVRFMKAFLYRFIYKFYYFQYRHIIKGLFAMGNDAANLYFKYGWKQVFPFMYLPNYVSRPICNSDSDSVRFLYIGRFEYETKGLDILMKAVDTLSENNYTIDLVGGYGANKDEVLSWCERSDKAHFLGKWPSDEVIMRMNSYDCCIVPSRYDGWNLTPQQAIYSGVGCIITNGAGSQEIIEDSRSGFVIPKNDWLSLADAMRLVIQNPTIINTWKSKAHEFIDNLSVETVGKYFIDGLSYFYGFSTTKPIKTW